MKDELYHYGIIGMRWGQRKANRYNRNVARANHHIADSKRQMKGLNDEAKDYEKAAKTAGKWKAKRLTKMAKQARDEANTYKEDIDEWKAIGDYQKNKAKRQEAKNKRYQKGYEQKKLTSKSSKKGKVVAAAAVAGIGALTVGALASQRSRGALLAMAFRDSFH